MKTKDMLDNVKDLAKKSLDSIDVNEIKNKAIAAGIIIGDKAEQVKDSAVQLKDDIEMKLTELDRELESAIAEYNDIYTLMNDKGYALYTDRLRSVDAIENIEFLINSIANHPKSFDTDFELINIEKEKFRGTCDFADAELQQARKSAEGAGAGVAAGAAVACLAPTAAMWIATTFGTASTGVAISTLSGAAATNAALAWLGGGALYAQGGGMIAGKALLALAGPIGWGIAGATLLTSIVLFSQNRAKLNKEKNEEIESIKNNTEAVKEVNAKIHAIFDETDKLRTLLMQSFTDSLAMFEKDYESFSLEEKQKLGAIVNNTKALATLCNQNIDME